MKTNLDKGLELGARWFSVLAATEALVALVVLAVIPHEGGSYSSARLGLLVFLGALAAAWCYHAYRPSSFALAVPSPAAIYLTGLACGLLCITLFLLRYLDPVRLAPYYGRLGVLLWYLLLLGLEAVFFLLARRAGIQIGALRDDRSLLRPWLVAFVIMLLAAVFIAATRLGLTPDPAYWGEPGVPVLGWQLGLALLAGLAVLLVSIRSGERPWFSAAGGAAIWIVASALWLSVPLSVMRNSFYAPINPPAYQAFPNSDAGYYDSMAQSLLIGRPYQGDIPSRPLYIVGLTLLHLIVGERYDLIVVGQTFALALIPVALYLLGRKLHSSSAGVIAALIAVFREDTTLLVSSATRVSDTKTLLADLPTLLLILVACLFTLRWFRQKTSRSAFLAGGFFGLLLLLRTQAGLILPIVLVLSVLVYGGPRRDWFAALMMCLVGFVVAISPWLLHNYLATGSLAFDAPFQSQIIASQYRYTGNLDINSIDLQGKSLFGIVWAFAIRDPGFVLGFVANHALATQVGALLALPLIATYNGLLAPINMYWLSWNGTISWYNGLLVCIYLVVIAVGLGSAWRRLRWAGLTPLAFSLGYSLANGLGRFSGWRYDLPADWIWYFFFSLGVAEVLGLLAKIFGAQMKSLPTDQQNANRQLHQVPLLLPAIAFLLVGASPWFAQGIARARYTTTDSAGLVRQLSAAPSVEHVVGDPGQLKRFASQPNAVVEVGRLLYPRYFARGDGLASAHPWPAYAPRDFPRLGFELLNGTRHDVVVPSRDQLSALHHASDVIVLGCQAPDHIDARLVFDIDSGEAFLAGNLIDPCP